MLVTYTATSGLIAGHAANTVYTLEIPIEQYIPSDETKGFQLLTSDDSETDIDSTKIYHKFTTNELDNEQMLEVREFLKSANEGQEVQLDIYGRVGSETLDIPVKLKFMKIIKASQPSYKRFKFQFQLIEFS